MACNLIFFTCPLLRRGLTPDHISLSEKVLTASERSYTCLREWIMLLIPSAVVATKFMPKYLFGNGFFFGIVKSKSYYKLWTSGLWHHMVWWKNMNVLEILIRCRLTKDTSHCNYVHITLFVSRQHQCFKNICKVKTGYFIC